MLFSGSSSVCEVRDNTELQLMPRSSSNDVVVELMFVTVDIDEHMDGVVENVVI